LREPWIPAVGLTAAAGNGLPKVRVALALGATRGGIYAAVAMFNEGKRAPAPKLMAGEKQEHFLSVPFPLSRYVAIESAVVEGEVIKRGQMIAHMANVRGGVHLRLRPLEEGSRPAQRGGETELESVGP